jgi:hypothetical protein
LKARPHGEAIYLSRLQVVVRLGHFIGCADVAIPESVTAPGYEALKGLDIHWCTLRFYPVGSRYNAAENSRAESAVLGIDLISAQSLNALERNANLPPMLLQNADRTLMTWLFKMSNADGKAPLVFPLKASNPSSNPTKP